MVRSDARRNIDRILEAAIRVLADQPAATLGEVADASGLHRATLHRHFTTREDLMRALQRRACDEAESALWAAGPQEGDFEDALRRVVRVAVELSDRYRVLLNSEDPEFTPLRERASRPLVALFEYGRATGALRRDVPVRWMQLTFRGILAASVDAINDGTLSFEEAARATAETLLGGLRVELRDGARGRASAPPAPHG